MLAFMTTGRHPPSARPKDERNADRCASRLRRRKQGKSHARRPTSHRVPEQGSPPRADRRQSILAALPHSRQLGLQGPRQDLAQGVDRGDGARRSAHRPHSVSRRPSRTCSRATGCGSDRTSRTSSNATSPPRSARARFTSKPLGIANSANDRVSKNVFEKLTADEEHHIDFLETQLELIRQVGVELYAQKHMGGLEE